MNAQPQYITNEKGEKMSVILSLADYQELLEDLENNEIANPIDELNQQAVLRVHSPAMGRTKEYRLMCNNKKYWLEFLIKGHFDKEIPAVQKYPLDWEESSKQLELLKTSALPLTLTSEPCFDFPSFELSIFGLCTEVRIHWRGVELSGCAVITNFVNWLISQKK
jgi:hypothetical protein